MDHRDLSGDYSHCNAKGKIMKKLVVLGAGESGVGAAELGSKQGYEVLVSDKGTIAPKYKDALLHLQVTWEEGKHTEEDLLKADIVVKSPGIPDDIPLIKKLVGAGIPVISEIEFASWFTDATLVAITGSNGKTTTAMLTYHILKEAGMDVVIAGNMGDSFAKAVAESEPKVFVLEVSSFQLDGIDRFRPHIAVLTNITPDHLDRYAHNFENYVASKFRITENQTEEDFFIYDLDDDTTAKGLTQYPVIAQRIPFSTKQKVSNGMYLKDNNIISTLKDNPITMTTETLALEGEHNLKNSMAASTVANLLKIRKETLKKSLSNFQGVPHRLEKVLKVNNVSFINDSKATNVNAAYYALNSMNAPTVWIVGGEDKGNDYLELMPLVREKVKAIICLGLDNSKIMDTFGPVADVMIETRSMKEAVGMAYQFAEPGDNVLLAPACASFDLFEDYEDRGDQFKEMVYSL